MIVRLNTEAHNFIKSNEFNLAANRFETVAKLSNTDFIVWYNLADAYRKAKMYRKAVDAYKNSLTFEDNNLVKFYIAVSFAQQNNVDEALNWLENSVYGNIDIYKYIKGNNYFESVSETDRYKKIIRKLELASFPCANNSQIVAFSTLKNNWEVKTKGGLTLGFAKFEYSEKSCVISGKLSLQDGSEKNLVFTLEPNSSLFTLFYTDNNGNIGMLLESNTEKMKFNTIETNQIPKAFIKTFSLNTDDKDEVQLFFETTNTNNETQLTEYILVK